MVRLKNSQCKQTLKCNFINKNIKRIEFFKKIICINFSKVLSNIYIVQY